MLKLFEDDDCKTVSSFYFKIEVTNSPPAIKNGGKFSDLSIKLNNSFELFLPPFEDPENHTVKIELASDPNIIN